MKLAAFGDSNTRYWLGNEGVAGPLREAWPARLEALLRADGKEVTVSNKGWPGAGIALARSQVGRMTWNADAVILSFGTNDIKLPEAVLEDFIGSLDTILKANGSRPLLVLSILWFGRGYGFSGSQDRLPEWNGAAEALCRQRGAHFWDTTSLFEGQLQFYNDHPVHHLNGAGQARFAQSVYEALQTFHMI